MTINLAQKTILGWGKLRRAYLGHLRKDYVKENIARRQGECKRCGACCKLMFRCWLLDKKSPPAACRRYPSRTKACQLFPIDERDFADRDLVEPGIKCGYKFGLRAKSIEQL